MVLESRLYKCGEDYYYDALKFQESANKDNDRETGIKSRFVTKVLSLGIYNMFRRRMDALKSENDNIDTDWVVLKADMKPALSFCIKMTDQMLMLNEIIFGNQNPSLISITGSKKQKTVLKFEWIVVLRPL